MMLFGWIVLFLAFSFQITARKDEITRISGHATGLSGTSVIFYSYRERQFDSRNIIADVPVDENGSFSFTFNCPETTVIYCETGIYTACLYVESGLKYRISLPEQRFPEPGKTMGPYYSPPTLHILPDDSVLNGARELNYAIRDYDSRYEPFLDEQLIRLYDKKQSAVSLDSFLHTISIDQDVTDPRFLIEYSRFKTAQLEYLLGNSDYFTLYEKYIAGKPLSLNNPAFWDLYKLIFERHIRSLAVRQGFEEIDEFIWKEQIDSLFQILHKDPLLENDTIRDLVLLNELYQGFYENEYTLPLALNLFDTIHNRTKVSFIKDISTHVRRSVSALQPGYPPPFFSVKSIEGKEYTPEDFKGKYLYIAFCSLNQMGSLSEIEYLKYQYSKLVQNLQIIMIIPEAEKSDIQSFIDNHSIKWPVLPVIDKELFRIYNVRAFPQFYLLDKEGLLILSPAPFPSANFEQVLFKIMKSRGDI